MMLGTDKNNHLLCENGWGGVGSGLGEGGEAELYVSNQLQQFRKFDFSKFLGLSAAAPTTTSTIIFTISKCHVLLYLHPFYQC